MLQNLVYATSIFVSDTVNKIKGKKWCISIMVDFTSRWIACESEARKHACSLFITVFQSISFSLSILLLIILQRYLQLVPIAACYRYLLFVLSICCKVLNNRKAIWNTQDTLYLRNAMVRSLLEYVSLSSGNFPA